MATEPMLNPNSGRVLKPRQLDFVDYYLTATSPTYNNAFRSAIRAGYSKGYSHSRASDTLVPIAQAILDARTVKTVDRTERQARMLDKAEQNIQSDLDIKDDEGPAMRALRNKTTTFVAETIGKVDYSKAMTLNTVHVALVSPNTLQALEATMVDALGTTPHVDTPVYTIKEGEDG